MDGAREFHGDPLVTADSVYIGTDGPAGFLYAFDRGTGEPRWKSAAEDAGADRRGFPTDVLQAGDQIYAAGIGGFVVSLNRSDGTPRWRFGGRQRSERGAFPNSAAIAGARLFFGSLDGTLHALDAATGTLVWKRTFASSLSTAVLPVAHDLIVGSSDGKLHRVRQRDGAVVASITLSARPAHTPVLHDGLIYVVSERDLFAVDASLSRVAWSRKAAKEWSTPRPRVWSGAVIVGDGADLHALDARTGEPRWTHRFEGTIRGVGAGADVLYVGTYKGDVFAFRPPR